MGLRFLTATNFKNEEQKKHIQTVVYHQQIKIKQRWRTHPFTHNH